MQLNRIRAGLFVTTAAIVAALVAPASAETSSNSVRAAVTSESDTLSAQATRRPRITIYPRRQPLSPSAKRICNAWLVQEYRVSGPVIVPQMRCRWE